MNFQSLRKFMGGEKRVGLNGTHRKFFAVTAKLLIISAQNFYPKLDATVLHNIYFWVIFKTILSILYPLSRLTPRPTQSYPPLR